MGRYRMFPTRGGALVLTTDVVQILCAIADHDPGAASRAMHTAAVAATVAVTCVGDVRRSGMHHVLRVITLPHLERRMLFVG